MSAESNPTLRERLAAGTASVLQRVGLAKVVESPLVRAVAKRFLLRPSVGPQVRVVVDGLAKGMKLRILPSSPRSYWLGTHEPLLQAMAQKHLKPGDVVYDCGANIGYFSVIFAKLVGPGGKVFAFEPSADSYASVEAARDENGLPIIPVQRAIWNENTTLQFSRGPGDASMVSDHVADVFGQEAQSNMVQVATQALDDFVYGQGNPAPDFIKLDVEGSEGKAVAGARRLLKEKRPLLLIEIHGEPGREVWPQLQELGYVPTNIATGKVPATVEEFAVWITQYLCVPTAT